MAKPKEVQSIYFNDLWFILRKGVALADFEQPPRPLQWAYRVEALLGWRLLRSRLARAEMEATEEARLKDPLRMLFGEGPIAGVARKSSHGSRVWVTQPMSKVPTDPQGLVDWLGLDAPDVIEGIEIDPV